MFYDALLLLSIYFIVTLILIPFNQGAAIEPGNAPYNLLLLLISYLYFAWHWTHGGQTLGMLAWKIRLHSPQSDKITWKQATQRYLMGLFSLSCFGLGFLWVILDSEKLAWHDRYSGTFLKIIKQ